MEYTLKIVKSDLKKDNPASESTFYVFTVMHTHVPILISVEYDVLEETCSAEARELAAETTKTDYNDLREVCFLCSGNEIDIVNKMPKKYAKIKKTINYL